MNNNNNIWLIALILEIIAQGHDNIEDEKNILNFRTLIKLLCAIKFYSAMLLDATDPINDYPN